MTGGAIILSMFFRIKDNILSVFPKFVFFNVLRDEITERLDKIYLSGGDTEAEVEKIISEITEQIDPIHCS